MGMSKERTLQAWVQRFLKEKKRSSFPGKLLFWWKVSDAVRVGLPDLKLILNGHSGAVELKAPGKVPTKLQGLTLDEMAEAGATVGCGVDSHESWEEFWRRYVAKAFE
jgi:hypothetical protein